VPRMFYKVIVGIAFALVGIALLAADAVVAVWLMDRGLAWLSYVLSFLIVLSLVMGLWGVAADCVRRA
jgi:hypothetical protein